MKILDIQNMHATISEADKEIIKGISFHVDAGETVALMGPNGSGKSTLAYTLAGHPKYQITSGDVVVDNQSILEMEPDERARHGVFLSFQYPATVAGVTVQNFLRAAYNNTHDDPLSIAKFRRLLKEKMADLKMDPSFADRYVNEGWSGGEKKRGEILQLSVLQPKIAILDETDSGLDIDAIRVVADGINKAKAANNSMGVLIITHYKRILEYIKPDRVLVLVDGKIVQSGGPEIVDRLESEGYDWVRPV